MGKIEILKSRIENDLKNLRKIRNEITEISYLNLSDYYKIKLFAQNLHDYYNGLERIFRAIAKSIDGQVPKGEDWHSELLENMALDLKDIRPAVISDALKESLHELRGFRHVFRSHYGFELNKLKVMNLLNAFEEKIFDEVEQALGSFMEFLETLTSTSGTTGVGS